MNKNLVLSDDAVGLVEARLTTLKAEAHSLLRLCESPVEQLFLAAAIDYFGLSFNEHFKRGQGTFSTGYPAADGIFTLLVEPQKEITCLDARYRADFLFSLHRFNSGGKSRLWGKTVVEIDGHDFHEKTKQQASRDKKRDRDLLAEGCFCMRFSGSDIFRNPVESVEEVYFHMDKCAHEAVKSFEESGTLSTLLWGGGV
ncbi:MAG: DUF559 domain-containing protein [Gammaproteobacteria bacterium]